MLIRTRALLLCLAAVLAGGSLRADGEVYLRNGTDRTVTVHRAPTPNRHGAHHRERMLAGRLGVPGPFKVLSATLKPEEDASLTLAPGEGAALGWEARPPAGAIAHVGVRIEGEERRAFLVYRATGLDRAPARLEPMAGFGPQAVLAASLEGGRTLYALTGTQAPPPPLPAPCGLDPDLDPDRAPGWPLLHPEVGRINAALSTRKLANRRFPGLNHLVSLNNRSGKLLKVVLPDDATTGRGPRLRMRLMAHGELGPWAQASPEQAIALVHPGQTLLLDLDRKVAHERTFTIALLQDGSKSVGLLRYVCEPGGTALLGPDREADKLLLGHLNPAGAYLSIDGASFRRLDLEDLHLELKDAPEAGAGEAGLPPAVALHPEPAPAV